MWNPNLSKSFGEQGKNKQIEHAPTLLKPLPLPKKPTKIQYTTVIALYCILLAYLEKYNLILIIYVTWLFLLSVI